MQIIYCLFLVLFSDSVYFITSHLQCNLIHNKYVKLYVQINEFKRKTNFSKILMKQYTDILCLKIKTVHHIISQLLYLRAWMCSHMWLLISVTLFHAGHVISGETLSKTGGTFLLHRLCAGWWISAVAPTALRVLWHHNELLMSHSLKRSLETLRQELFREQEWVAGEMQYNNGERSPYPFVFLFVRLRTQKSIMWLQCAQVSVLRCTCNNHPLRWGFLGTPKRDQDLISQKHSS